MLHCEFEELVKMTREHVIRDPEREMAERKEASHDSRSVAAHASVIAITVHMQLQGLAFRRHVEAAVRELIEVPVTARVVPGKLPKPSIDGILDTEQMSAEVPRQGVHALFIGHGADRIASGDKKKGRKGDSN